MLTRYRMNFICLFLFFVSLNGAEPYGSAQAELIEHLQQHIKYSSTSPNTVGYIVIEDHAEQISQSTYLYVKKALDYYKKTKPAFIILKLNTPGGQIYPAQQISSALREMDLVEKIPIVAFIDDWAMSAGAMIAYSSRFIATVSDGSMGAAEPVIQSSEGELKTASEKITSAIRTDFANKARYFGRNPDIAEAMVDKDIILVWRNGKVVRVDNTDQINYKGADPDVVISPYGKLLTLDAEQMLKYGVADLLLTPKAMPPISISEIEQGRWPADKLLLFQYPFFKEMPQTTIDAYVMDWKTRFFVWITSPVVSSLLFMAMLLGFYIEMNTPGFGLAGTVAVTSLLLVILSTFSLELANWLELILVLTGIGFILAEVFLIPAAGLLGVIGLILFLAGLFGMLIPAIDFRNIHFDWDSNTFNAAGQAFLERLTWLCGAFLLALALMALFSRYVAPNVVWLNRFVLKGGEQDASEGYFSGPSSKTLPPIGTVCNVVSALRPAGKVSIQDDVYQAISYGTFLSEGSHAKIVGYQGGTLVVEEVYTKENPL
ncbi:MAG: NfeD family protein [Parachlamydiales bacterium]|jgi:membrane-bound ClpP family serine protease